MKIAVVGATGLVGGMMLKILEERNFPVSELIPAASERSVGKTIRFKKNEYRVVSIAEAIQRKPGIALFSAGSEVSREFAPKFAEQGTVVIDNSSAWRGDPEIKLVVPEVNGQLISKDDRIIANPNCSTIQMVVALDPLHRKYGIKRIVASTYQAVSGSGYKALEQMEAERQGKDSPKVYPHNIDKNCLPHAGEFLENDYTSEEMKLLHETRKIIGNEEIRVSATAVRIPVETSHSESINVEFGKEFDIREVREILENAPGIKVLDNPVTNTYPMPIDAAGKDEVFVGRIRRDDSRPNTLNMWVVADNLRKGAATNAVQIAEIVAEVRC